MATPDDFVSFPTFPDPDPDHGQGIGHILTKTLRKVTNNASHLVYKPDDDAIESKRTSPDASDSPQLKSINRPEPPEVEPENPTRNASTNTNNTTDTTNTNTDPVDAPIAAPAGPATAIGLSRPESPVSLDPKVTADSNTLRINRPKFHAFNTSVSSVANVNAVASSEKDVKKDQVEDSNPPQKSLQTKISSIFNNLPNDIEVSDDLASDTETLHASGGGSTPPSPAQELAAVLPESGPVKNPLEMSLYSDPTAMLLYSEATSIPLNVKAERGRSSSSSTALLSLSVSSFHALNHNQRKKPSSNLSSVLLGNAKSIISNNIVLSASSIVAPRRKKKKPKNKSQNPLKNGGIPKKYWMNDAFVSDCLNCFRPFSAFRRKHHCRFCGQIFCSDCTLFISYNQHKQQRTKMDKSDKNANDKLRVCQPCYDDVIVYLSDSSEDSASDGDNAIVEDDTLEVPDHPLSRIRSVSVNSRDTQTDYDLTPTSSRVLPYESPRFHSKQAPQMAIPTTRTGEAVEIPVPKSYTSTGKPNLTMLALLNAAGSIGSSLPADERNWYSRQMQLSRSNSLDNFSHIYTSFLSKRKEVKNKRSDLLLQVETTPESETENEDDQDLESENENEDEDEKVMSLYTSLNNPEPRPSLSSTSTVPTLTEFPTMSAIEKRFSRGFNFNLNSGVLFLDERPVSETKSSERAHASLMRMQSRRKSKSARNILTIATHSLRFPEMMPLSQPASPSNLSKQLGRDEEDSPKKSLDGNFSPVPASIVQPDFEPTAQKYDELVEQLLLQSLEDCDVSENKQRWVDALKKVLVHIDQLKLTDTLDIKQYVKIKKNLGGKIEDTGIIDGLLMTKNIDLRKMSGRISNPKIALLMFPLEYLKQKQQFISLRIVHSQLAVYITNLVSRLIMLEPDIVVVGDSVCGLAEKLLEEANITVLSNVKPQVVERISRYTKADIFQSINDLFFKKGILGTCKLFEVRKFVYNGQVKTFTFFTGSDIQSGFTICLRGGDEEVLNSVKYAAETLISAVINARFEKGLMDSHSISFIKSSSNPAAGILDTLYELRNDESDDMLVSCNSALDTHEIVNYIKLFIERKISYSPAVRYQLPTPLLNVVQSYEEFCKFHKTNQDIQTAATLEGVEDHLAQLNLNIDPNLLPHQQDDLLSILKYASDWTKTSLYQDFQSRIRTWSNCMNYTSYQLYPLFHKKLHFLYLTVSIKHATPCTGPNITVVEFYTENDKPLGWYLDQIFKEAGRLCDECSEPMINHYKTYVHGNSKIDLTIERYDNFSYDSHFKGKNQRVMWSSCKECNYSTPIVTMSDTASCLSIGKFLELCFWGQDMLVTDRNCQHDFFQSHVRYFAFNDLVIRMDFSPIDNYEIIVPKKKLEFVPEVDIKLKVDAFNMIQNKTNTFFQSISKRLNRVKLDTFNKAEDGTKQLQDLKTKLDSQIEQVQSKILLLYDSTPPTVYLPLNAILQDLQELGVDWDNEFIEFEKNFLPTENEITRITQFHLRNFLMDKYNSEGQTKEVELNDMPKTDEKGSQPEKFPSVSLKPNDGAQNSNIVGKIQKMEELLEQESFNEPKASDGSKPSQSKVQDLAKYYNEMNFNQLSKEFKERRERELSEKRSHNKFKAFPVVASKPIVEIYNKIEDVVDVEDNEFNRRISKRPTEELKREPEKLEPEDNNKDKPEDKPEAKLDIPQPEKNSLLKSLTNFWADRSATLWDPLEYPLEPTEHTFADSDVIVREDEPSSLVAFCLSSNDYKQKINVMADDIDNEETKTELTELDSKKLINFHKIEKKFKKSVNPTANAGGANELEQIMTKNKSNHLKYQYIDGNTILSCKIFYSEQFEAFRESCGANDSFIQSLSRCIKWNSKGGKSGSSFLKTLDNRYILKELSKSELESFVSIAPFYFKYISQSMFNTLSTAVAKIFGFYQIFIKNSVNGKTIKMDFLIMENLFYNHNTTRIFDLKGSMRNRHVQQTGKENEVLLDENMIEYIYESPVFVKEQLKKLLRGSLFNDTSFLSAMDVMDYSLVIGIDDQLKKLFIGIIDWLRTFTWDKKVENWVKGNSLVGKKGKDPTIVTPKQYRIRFREAMERYILEVPDTWYEGR